MGFQEGNTFGKGRPPGSPNKATAALRKTVSDFLEHNLADVQAVYDKAGEREKLSFLVQLLRFALPQLQSIEMQSDFQRMTDSELRMIIEELKEQQI